MKALKIVLAAVILLGGILAFNACQSLASPIEEYNWLLYYWVHNGDVVALVPDSSVTALFSGKDKTISGSGGCNAYSGTYKLDGLTLTINDDIISTKMYCDGGVSEQETAFFNALTNTTHFKLDHGNLIMYCGMDTLQFKRIDSTLTTPNDWGE
jgi:heat shock protein HslJ